MNLPSTLFCYSSESQSENKESEKVFKYLDLARGLKNAVDHEGNGDTNCSLCAWDSKVWEGNWKN